MNSGQNPKFSLDFWPKWIKSVVITEKKMTDWGAGVNLYQLFVEKNEFLLYILAQIRKLNSNFAKICHKKNRL